MALLVLCGALLGAAHIARQEHSGSVRHRSSVVLRASDRTSPSGPSLTASHCLASTSKTLASVDGNVAERIYIDELKGPATIADKHQVEEYGPLLAALSEGDRTAVEEAVTALVYSHTHIVRLRVSQGGSLLADVGGQYIIAPVGGSLHFHARLVGTYLLSVQDDLGFVGLEKRLIGMPLALHVNHTRVPVNGTLDTGSVALPSRGEAMIHRISYQTYSFNAKAYPTGSLRISLLLPPQRQSTRSCAAVKVAELGRIGHRIWNRFVIDKSSITGFVTFAQGHTGSLVYVRAGSRQIAGSTRLGPPRLPKSGTVRYWGKTYGVTSFAAPSSLGALRVYQLVLM